jgi:Transglutaminase-like superfamily
MATLRTEARRPAALRLPPARPLSAAQRARLAGEIVTAYLQARRELRRAPIASVVAALRSDQGAASQAPEREKLEEALRLGRAVSRTLALMPGDTRCLARSLVLTRLLARRGLSAKLVIGARATPDFLAHAWVEYGGEPVLPPGDESFGRLVEL